MGAVCCKQLKERFKKVPNNNVGDAVDEEDYENPTLIPEQMYDNAAFTPTTEPEAQSEPETTEAEPRAGETNFFCKSLLSNDNNLSCIH